jgi:hypothetical protein
MKTTAKAKFRASTKGQKMSIELTVKEYERLLDDLEEPGAIRAFDAAKSSGETPILFDQAIREIKRLRK